MTETEKDIHQQLRALLDREHATYRVIEHEPEGRTEMIAKIRVCAVLFPVKFYHLTPSAL